MRNFYAKVFVVSEKCVIFAHYFFRTMQLTRSAYHADTSRVSKSGLDCVNTSPLHFWDKYLNPDHPERKQAKHYRVGDVSNDLLLLPKTEFTSLYALVPIGAPKRPTEAQLKAKRPSLESQHSIVWWNDFTGNNPGKTVVMPDEWDTARFVRDAVLKHRPAAELLSEGYAEKTFYFDEPETGAKCKCRPDWMATRARLVVDLKTTIDASAVAFGRSAWKYRYDVQGAFYFDGVAYATGEYYDGFAFIAAEKERPYPVKVYYMDEDDFRVGRRRYMANLETYVQCLASGVWPAYGERVERLQLPNYVFNS